MTNLYPAIEPHATGMLDVCDSQQVWWETSGTPGGKPALVLHGGPGSGCAPAFRRFFDPGAYRIVCFDQRGSGRSTPHASDPGTDLSDHHAWLDDGALLGGAGRLADIPGVLVHGRYDLGGPPAAAWDLARAWPGAELHLVDGGHTGSGEMTRNLIAATDRFAGP